MKFSVIIALSILLPLTLIQAQSGKKSVLASIGDYEVSPSEFERYLEQATSGSSGEKLPFDELFEDFINFKRKVIEAENLGYDTSRLFINEYSHFSEELAKTYKTMKKDEEYLLNEAFRRAQTDVSISHIFVHLNQENMQEDTAVAYSRAMQARQRILDGENFDSVAVEVSDDPSVMENGGDLGYFTVFYLPYQLENVMYSLKPGEISLPVRTEAGYHVIRVNEERPARGKVNVAHIMYFTPDTSEADLFWEKVMKMNLIRDSLFAGFDFAELARRNSEDTLSAESGGSIGYIGIRQMEPVFEETAFALEKPGEITREPFRTRFGFHLLKLLGKKGVDDSYEMRHELMLHIKGSNRENEARLLMLDRMKQRYGFKDFTGDMSYYFDIIDDKIFEGNWTIPDNIPLEDTVFTIGNRVYSQMDYVKYLEANQVDFSMSKVTFLNMKMMDFIEESLFAYERENLPVVYPEYRQQLREYHDGILLYNITEDRVGARSVTDTAGLRAFFSGHRDQYKWKKRIGAVIVSSQQRDIVVRARRLFQENTGIELNYSALIARLCAPDYNPDCLSYKRGLYERGDHELVDKMDWKDEISEIAENNGRYVFIVRKEIHPSRLKSLEEAHSQLIQDYKNYLEEQWIRDLKQKYPVRIIKKQYKAISKRQVPGG